MLLIALLVLLVMVILASLLLPAFVGGAWSPTPMPVVIAMLERAAVRAGQVLYDLGAGDGRMVVQAARRGAMCYAVEVDPLKAWFIRLRARSRSVAGRIRVVQENFFRTDLSNADVITAYLSPAAMAKLAPKLARELKPGARVVSYRRPIPGWVPESTDNEIYLYKMPQPAASAAGTQSKNAQSNCV